MKYERPIFEIVELEEDIVTVSFAEGPSPEYGNDDTPILPMV